MTPQESKPSDTQATIVQPIELPTGDIVKVKDEGDRAIFDLYSSDNDSLAYCLVVFGENHAVLFDFSTTSGHKSSGKGTEVYKTMLGYVLESRPDTTSFLVAIAHAHMASIIAKNMPEGWKGIFESPSGDSFTPEQLLNNPKFEQDEKNGNRVILNFKMDKLQ